jgi:16S rRNA processing protein RimM
MIDLSDCSVLGTIAKTHGIRGQVLLRLNNFSYVDIIKMETVFIEIDGLPVPFFITAYSEKNYDSLVLTFEDVESESKAKEFIGCRVFINSKALKADSNPSIQTSTLLGYEVFDLKHGRLGILTDILDTQQNPLFRILDGRKEILVPLQNEFIYKINKSKKSITLDTPTGLINLF